MGEQSRNGSQFQWLMGLAGLGGNVIGGADCLQVRLLSACVHRESLGLYGLRWELDLDFLHAVIWFSLLGTVMSSHDERDVGIILAFFFLRRKNLIPSNSKRIKIEKKRNSGGKIQI